MTDAEIRNAAETLLSPSYNYMTPNNGLLSDLEAVQRLEHQLSSTHNSLSSLETTHCEELSSGARRNGHMSVVRRFFCLFVLFDLLLISLIWLICVMLMGSNNLIQTLKMQVVYYKITTSLFDLVLAAFCRFTVLLLFYGLLHLNTTFYVAVTTLGTCVFLIFKVVYYSWNSASQPAVQGILVILLLISFVIAWSETWFLDFRVLPQERFALYHAQHSGRFSESLNTLLLDPNLVSPVMRHFLRNVVSNAGENTESIGNFHSAVESTNDSGDEADEQKPNRHTRAEYVRRGRDTLEVAWSILNECNWKLQKKTPKGDSVYTKNVEQLGKVFLLTTEIDIPARKLLRELFVNVDKYPLWNTTVLESKRLEYIDDHTDITYQVSAPGGNGVVSSRDFVILRHWDVKGDSYVLAGISIPYPKVPASEFYIRGENGPCCWVMRPLRENYDKCVFEFLLNTNLKGWIPKYVLESSLTSVLLEYSESLKQYCAKLENT